MKKVLFLLLALAFIAPLSDARQPGRGYRGFVEWSSSLRSESFLVFENDNFGSERQSTFYTGFSTSHGYQINPMFFVGAGVSLERCGKMDNWIAPLFVQDRVDLQLGRFTPFGDLRIGLNTTEGSGLYFSPSVGYRFYWGRKAGINLGVGLTLAGYKVEHYEASWVNPDSYTIQYVGTQHHIRPYFSFRLGIDF